jgi:hypothetical protein
MITVAGEALIDLIVDPAGHVDPRAGGGPFNVTRAVVRPGLPVAFPGRLSGDRFGQPMRADLERHHLTVAAGTPAESPTTLTCWTWTRPACPPTTSTWPARRRRRSGPARPCCRTAPRAGRNVLGLGTPCSGVGETTLFGHAHRPITLLDSVL